MSNNILDKSAMRSLAEISVEVPHILDQLKVISSEQKTMRGDIVGITSNQVQMTTKLEAIEKSIVDIPKRCPYREAISKSEDRAIVVKGIVDDVSEIRQEIASLKTADRIYGTFSALLATVASTMINSIGKT